MIKSGRYLIPGQPDASEIVARLAPQGNMPPSGEFASEDYETLVQWIQDLVVEDTEPLSNFDELTYIRQDLEQIQIATRPFIRYFSLRTSYNGKASKEIFQKAAVRHLAKQLTRFPFQIT